MSRPLLRHIIDAIAVGESQFAHLKGVELICAPNDSPLFYSGRAGITFAVKHRGQLCGLKCYTAPQSDGSELCGLIASLDSTRLIKPRFYPAELFVAGSTFEGYINVELYEWAEGNNLDYQLRRAAFNNQVDTLATLSRQFTLLAIEILDSTWRHGDLKPENIIVAPDSTMRLVDLDSLHHPSIPKRNHCGTEGFIHPSRGSSYDNHIDDYSIALICVVLHAIARRPQLLDEYGQREFVVDPHKAVAGRDPAIETLLRIFEPDSPLAALTTALTHTDYKINQLNQLLKCIVHP